MTQYRKQLYISSNIKKTGFRLCVYSKPAVHRLHAEVPCNYTLGRLAAALQSVFEYPHALAPVFFCIDINKIIFCIV